MSNKIKKLIVKQIVNVGILAAIGYAIKVEMMISDRIDRHYSN